MPNSLSHRSVFLLQTVAVCALSTYVIGQQPRSPQMPAPPPMRFVSRAEEAQLSAETNPKARLRATVDLAENHLLRVENLTDQKKFDEASSELGCYLGVIDDLRYFLATLNSDKSSTRDLYRHMEIAVRAHLPRLAVLRRTTPLAYASHIKDAEEYIKDTRSAALDSFYGHSVLREITPNKAPANESPSQSRDIVKRP